MWFRQRMPRLPKFYKRLLGKIFGWLFCLGVFYEIMKQFGVIQVVRCLKGYLVAVLYFSNEGQCVRFLESANSTAKFKKPGIACIKCMLRNPPSEGGKQLSHPMPPGSAIFGRYTAVFICIKIKNPSNYRMGSYYYLISWSLFSFVFPELCIFISTYFD